MSISKAQAEAIADGFLNSIGSGNADSLKPKSTFTEIILIAGELIESAQANLIKSNSIASGKLSESLIAHEPYLDSNTLVIDVYMQFYGLFVNSGVKGTKSGSSKAGYAFQYDNPSKKMVEAIKQWIDRGKTSISNVKQYKNHGRHERKTRKLARLAESDSSYAVARSIKQHGIKRTGFLDQAVLITRNKVASRLGVALKIDLLDSLTGENLK